MYAALRFMPLARDEFDILRSAHTVRGAGRRPGPMGWFREYLAYAIPLLATMIRKAIRTAIAMESKAFGAYPTRTYMEQVTIPWTDIVWLVALLVIEVLLVMVPQWIS
jgi:energy-coupling factor transport system permease protein